MDSSKIVIVIYNNLPDQCKPLKNNFRDLLKFRLLVGAWHDDRKIEILETSKLSYTLKKLSSQYDWAVVVAIASYIREQANCLDIVQHAIKENSPLAGHILDRPGYYHLHHQFFALNLQVYKEIGFLNFEENLNERIVLKTYETERSLDNMHDDYTPPWIKPKSTNIVEYKTQRYFAVSVLAELIKHNYKIVNIPQEIRNEKAYSYVEHCYQDAVKFLNDPTYDCSSSPFQYFASQSEYFFKQLDKGYYVINTEPLSKIPDINNFDNFIGVCGGIKPSCIVGSENFLDNTKVNLFDISDGAINWQKFLIENWDGSKEKFESVFNDFKIKYPDYIPSYYSRQPIIITMEKMLVDNKLTYLEFKKRWSKYLKMTHTFTKLNILEDSGIKKLSELVNLGTTTYLWTSNCFYMDWGLFFKTKQWLENKFNEFKNEITDNAFGSVILEDRNCIIKLK